MELRQLRYFLSVAEELHFGRAAERMNIVQPALSMQIRALEGELGVQLFRRTSRRVELTEAGRVFRAEAEQAILQTERAKRVAQQAAEGVMGRVRIGFVGNVFFAGILSSNLHAFRSDHPNVAIELEEMTVRAQVDAILDRRLDIGYCPAFTPNFHPGLTVHTLGAWPWALAMAGDHRLAKLQSIGPEDVEDEAFILYSASGVDIGQLPVMTKLLGYEPRVAYRVAHTLTVLALASAGLGIALVPGHSENIRVKGLEYRPFRGNVSRSKIMLINHGAEASPAVLAYVNAARKRQTTFVSG